MSSFLTELKRRNVVKVGIAYAIVAWVLTQIVIAVKSPLHLPEWMDTFIILLLIIGFPIALIITWAFELTPEGIKRTEPTSNKSNDTVTTDAARTEETAGLPSIAVLPFVNMSSDPEQEYFSDGLSEELLNQLAQIDKLKVIGRTSSFAFKGRNVDLREIGEQLGAAHLLEGSVRKSGDRLRITAQLIETRNGHHLWSETYDRRLDDVFAIQDEIARTVTDALSITLGVSHTTETTGLTEDVEAYDLYLRGRAFYHRSGPAELEHAGALFQQALSRDPDFSRARAGLITTYAYELIYVPERRPEAEQAIVQAATEGHNRAPDDWATYQAAAVLHMVRYEWKDAEDAFNRAAARTPASVPEGGDMKSMLLMDLGRLYDAVKFLRALLLSDPLSISSSFSLQYALWMLGRNEESEAEYLRSLDLPGVNEREDIPHVALCRVWNGDDHALIKERFDAYLNHQTVPTPWIKKVREVYDDPEAALVIIRTAFDDPANQDSTRMMFVASYSGHFGDAELALKAARRALVDMRGLNVHLLWFPDMAAVRRLPGFKDLVREIGLLDYWRNTRKWSDLCRPVGADDFECD